MRPATFVARAVLAAACLAFAGCDQAPPTAPTPVPTTPTATSGVAPSITAQPSPAAQTITLGQTATLSIVATGDAPLTYQWYFGDAGDFNWPIADGIGSTVTTPAIPNSANIWVRVSNAFGAVNSAAASIDVIVPPPPPPPAVPAGDAALEDAVLVIVNQQRAAGAVCGTTTYPPALPLGMDANLRTAARAHSDDMGVNGYFSHTSLDGRTFSQRIRNAGYAASPIGENIAAGYPTPAAVMAGWMSSPGHCANIMSSGHRSVGVGYAYRAGSPYGYYWTQDFGGQ